LNRGRFGDIEQFATGEKFSHRIKPKTADLQRVGGKMGISKASMLKTINDLGSLKRKIGRGGYGRSRSDSDDEEVEDDEGDEDDEEEGEV